MLLLSTVLFLASMFVVGVGITTTGKTQVVETKLVATMSLVLDKIDSRLAVVVTIDELVL